jgi:hypothetical protein
VERSIRQEELDLERMRISTLALKHGFIGSLCSATIGLAFSLGLAFLSTFTSFKIETWGIVALGLVTLAGILPIYFFLWESRQTAARHRTSRLLVDKRSESE